MDDGDRLQGKGFEIGDVFFGQFQIQEILNGGMGIVFIARDLSIDPAKPGQRLLEEYGAFSTCAVKTFQDRFLDKGNVVEQFMREAVAWVKLPRHEHVVFAHYVNIIEGRPYLFLERVDGTNLRDWLETSPLTPAQACAFALQICEGMIHVHEVGKLLHRDLKPENLLIDNEGTLKVTDLGLVRALDASDVGRGRQPGTLAYMAPEQFHGESSIQSDMYSFGVVLYEMFTGQRPSLGRDPAVSKAPHQINAAVPCQLSEIVMNCLAARPSQRYSSFAAIKEQLVIAIERFFPEAIEREKEPEDILDIFIIAERRQRQSDPDAQPSPHASYLIGHSMACLGKYDEALRYFQPLMGEDDGGTEVARSWIAGGLCLNALGRYDEALQAFKQSLEMRVWADNQRNSYIHADGKWPKRGWLQRGRTLPFVWAAMAYSWLRLGNRSAALECLTEALNLEASAQSWPTMFHPLTDSPEHEAAISSVLKTDRELRALWYEVKGNLLLGLGRAAEAVRCFQNIRDIDPGHVGALRRQAAAWLEAGESRRALECCQLVTKSESATWKDWRDRGQVHGVLGEYNQAADCFGWALVGHEGEWRLWIEKGKALACLKFWEEATACMEKAIRLAPNQPDAWAARGGLWLVQHCFEDAVSCYDQALGLDSEHAEAAEHRALALRLRAGPDFDNLSADVMMLQQSGRFEEALEKIDELLQLSPKSGNFWAAKAAALSDLGRHEEALAATNEALRYDSASPAIHKARGNVLDKMGSHQAALKAFDRALALDPTFGSAWNDKGYLLKRLEQYAAAMNCYRQAVACEPQNWIAWGNLGSLLGSRGEHKEALDCFEKTLALNPDSLLARRNRDVALRLLAAHGS